MELLIKSSQVLLSPTELFTIIKVPGFSSKSDGTFHKVTGHSRTHYKFFASPTVLFWSDGPFHYKVTGHSRTHYKFFASRRNFSSS